MSADIHELNPGTAINPRKGTNAAGTADKDITGRHFLRSAHVPDGHPSKRLLRIEPIEAGYRALIRGHSRDRINALQRAIAGASATQIHMPHTGIKFFPPKTFGHQARTKRVIDELVAPYPRAAKRYVKKMIYRGQAWFIAALMMRSKPDVCICWNGVRGHRRLFMDVAQDLGMIHLYMEEAPIPGRITCDLAGVNFENSLPRRMDFYRAWQSFSGVAPQAWRALSNDLVARQTVHPYTAQERRDISGEGKYIFCPLQVPTDSQVVSFGGRLKSMQAYVAELCDAANALPRGWHLRIKEHPSSKITFQDIIAKHAGEKLKLDNKTDTFLQVKHAQSVLTLNSSVGIQSFYFDKPVMTLGQAFWDFGGLAEHLPTGEALREALSKPDRSWFSTGDRDAFMNYLTYAYYMVEQDVVLGKVGLNDIIMRAKRRDTLLDHVLRETHPTGQIADVMV